MSTCANNEELLANLIATQQNIFLSSFLHYFTLSCNAPLETTTIGSYTHPNNSKAQTFG
uniref:Uncharacterized protein n=1 Tax=Rhizophora mucronata TaxID=61149 RepID=A0A2P2MJ72_RHIMU